MKFKVTTREMKDVLEMSTIDHRLNTNFVVDKLTEIETLGLIKFGQVEPRVKLMLDQAHIQHKNVFTRDLTHGYNHHFGKHVCKLNWTTLQRPDARKVPFANYDQDMRAIMQELCDDLTN